MPNTPAAIVFDFDGVLLQSVDIKTRAFAELFSGEEPDARQRIVDYHMANGGISRFEKFRWAYENVLRRPLSPSEEQMLGRRFNELVERAVLEAPWVPGAQTFVEAQHTRTPLFVASGTPEEELRRIVSRRGMDDYFRGVFGSPRAKRDILLSIAADLQVAPETLLMIGDAVNDYDAAAAAGSGFIGVGLGSAFPAHVTTIPDLTQLADRLEGFAARRPAAHTRGAH